MKFRDITVAAEGAIEDAHGMLQVDFANKCIGGGEYLNICSNLTLFIYRCAVWCMLDCFTVKLICC